jgi:C1A family cysteine protease
MSVGLLIASGLMIGTGETSNGAYSQYQIIERDPVITSADHNTLNENISSMLDPQSTEKSSCHTTSTKHTQNERLVKSKGECLANAVSQTKHERKSEFENRSQSPKAKEKVDVQFVSHLATKEEIESMKAGIGVRDFAKNYNIIVDGHGTGLTPPTEQEWDAMIGSVKIVDSVTNPRSRGSVDHSQEPCFPVVGNQGGQGSCASWATAYYTNGYQQALDKGWTDASTGNIDHLMSPAWAYNKVNHGMDAGSHTMSNANLIQSVGNAKWVTMPYDDTDCVSWGVEDAWRDAPEYRCSNIYTIWSPFDAVTINSIKSALDSNHLVTFALNSSSYSGLGPGDDTLTSAEIIPGYDHANTIVGYDDSKTANGETGAFKIVNSWGVSWGASWGGNGYYWITYQAFQPGEYAVVWFDDLPNYQPSLLEVWNLNPQGARDAPITIGIGPYGNPDETRSPTWDGGSYDFSSFMCLDATEFEDDWNTGSNTFFLEIGSGSSSGIITSFKIEFYEDGYNPASPTQISSESPDTPRTTPGYVTVSFIRSYISITNPSDGEHVRGLTTVSGIASGSMNTEIFKEDFEEVWPGSWNVGDSNSDSGYDYWGDNNYRAYAGSWSGWCADYGWCSSPITETYFYEDFEDDWPNDWDCFDQNSSSGYDYWGDNSDKAYLGWWSGYCADEGTGPDYDNDMDAWMIRGPFDLSTATNAELNFHYWLDSELDYDYFQWLASHDGTHFGGWQTSGDQSGGGWQYISFDLSDYLGDDSVWVAFSFISDTSTCGDSGYEGAYVDEVRLIVTRYPPNTEMHQYDNEMDAYMYRSVALSSCNSATLSYKYWLDSESDLDYLYVIYYDASDWQFVDPHTGNSGGWQSSSIAIPTTATDVGIHFYSDNIICSYEGAYIDNVILLGLKSITGVEVKIDSGSWDTATGTTSWFYDWNTTSYSDGQHTIYARACYGTSYSDVNSVTVTVDNTPPSTSYTLSGVAGENGWYSSDVDVTLSASDATSGVTSTKYRVDGGSWQTYTGSFVVSGDGTHIVEYYSIDNDGNIEPTKSATLKIDTIAPHSLSIFIKNDDIYTTTTSIALTVGADDATSGVWQMCFSDDGMTWGSWETYSTSKLYTLPSGDGTKTVYFKVRDYAGNEIIAIDNIILDTISPLTTPSLSGDAGENDWCSSDVDVTLSASDATSGVTSTKYRVDGGSWQTYTGSFIISGDGSHNVGYYSIDNAGNVEGSQSVSINIDTVSPSTIHSLFGDIGENGWYTSDVDVILSASDDTSGVASIMYRIDNESWQTYSPVLLESLHLYLSGDGTQTIEYYSSDNAGNSEAIKTFTVGIDTTSPTTTNVLMGTIGNNNWYISDVNITLTPSDITSGINYTKYRVDNGTWQTYTTPIHVTSDGNHTIDCYSVDCGGNVETTRTLVLKIDTTKPSDPELSVSSGHIFTSSSISIFWIASDATSNIDHYEVKIDSEDYVNVGLNTTYTFAGVSDGAHTFHIKVVDKAGNYREISAHVKVDTNPFSPFGPYMGIPLYLLIGAIVVVTLLVVMKRKKKGKDEELESTSKEEQPQEKKPPQNM